MISFSSNGMSKEGQKEISFSLKEEAKDILLRERNTQRRRRRRKGGEEEEEVERRRQNIVHGDRADAASYGAVAPCRASTGCRLRVTPLVPGRERSMCAGSTVIDMLADIHLDMPQVWRRIALRKAVRI